MSTCSVLQIFVAGAVHRLHAVGLRLLRRALASEALALVHFPSETAGRAGWTRDAGGSAECLVPAVQAQTRVARLR
jgi:hypothetical protein